jgi:predicted nucleic acid-binding Zn ribbon protein
LIGTLAQAIEAALARRGLGDLWWGARVLDAWPHVVGSRCAEAARPNLDKSPLRERGLLTVAVRNSAWMQELSFLNLTERLNDALGQAVVRTVRFELREVLP